MRLLIAILLTVKFTWAANEGVAFFKFLDSGVSNEKMIPLNALFGLPLQTLVMLLVAKYSAVPKPTKIYIYAIPFRTIFALLGAGFIWLTPRLIPADGIAATYIYIVYLANSILYGFCLSTMFITMTAVFIKVSDPTVGGTYMTLLNTVDNMGGTYSNSLAVWLVEYLTWRDCGGEIVSEASLMRNQTDVGLLKYYGY